MARKSKLTKELIKEAYKLVSAGNYIKDVYPILGIESTTWFRWLREGEAAKSGIKRQFWQTIKIDKIFESAQVRDEERSEGYLIFRK